MSRKFNFHQNQRGMTGTLHADLCTIMTSRSVRLIMRNVSDKSCGENQNTFSVH